MLSRKKTLRLEVRLSEEDKARLKELTERMNTSEGDVIREALRVYYCEKTGRNCV